MEMIRKLYDRYAISTTSVVVFFLLWQFGSVFRVIPVDYIGTPSNIFVEFFKLFNEKMVFDYLLPSVEALILGISISLILGIIFGFAIGVSDLMKKIMKPFLVAVNSVPMIVFFPLLILAFGISLWSVVLTIVLMCFVPIMINVIEGISSTDTQLLMMAKSFGASRGFVLRNVTLYSAFPYILAAAKSSVGKSVIALIVAEIYGLNRGIGYLVSYYGSTFQADKLFALVLFILLLNGLLFFIIWLIEKRFKKY